MSKICSDSCRDSTVPPSAGLTGLLRSLFDTAALRAIFENAAVGIAHVALDGHWLRVNHTLCEIPGYSEEDLLRTSFQDMTHADDLETDLEELARALGGGGRDLCDREALPLQ